MVIEKFTMPDAYAYPDAVELAKIVSPPEPTTPDWLLRPRCSGALTMTDANGKTWTKWI